MRGELIEAKLLCQNQCFQKWITKKYILRMQPVVHVRENSHMNSMWLSHIAREMTQSCIVY